MCNSCEIEKTRIVGTHEQSIQTKTTSIDSLKIYPKIWRQIITTKIDLLIHLTRVCFVEMLPVCITLLNDSLLTYFGHR